MITYPKNGQAAQAASLIYKNNPVMRVIADNKQVYPNGIYAESHLFPGKNNISYEHGCRILTPSLNEMKNNLWTAIDMPLIASNKTINGISGYNIFRLYRSSEFGWSWVNPDPRKSDMWIGTHNYKWTDWNGESHAFDATVFNWPSGLADCLGVHSMVDRRIMSNSSQPNPFYIYWWNSNRSVDDNIIYGLLHTVPAASGGDVYFDEINCPFDSTGNVSYSVVLAIKSDWKDGGADLSLSFNLFFAGIF